MLLVNDDLSLLGRYLLFVDSFQLVDDHSVFVDLGAQNQILSPLFDQKVAISANLVEAS